MKTSGDKPKTKEEDLLAEWSRLSPREKNRVDRLVVCGKCNAGIGVACKDLPRGQVHFARRLRLVLRLQAPIRRRKIPT